MLNREQIEFIQFVLGNYVQEGIDELDMSKLSTILSSNGGVSEAQKVLGSTDEIQKFLEFSTIYMTRQLGRPFCAHI